MQKYSENAWLFYVEETADVPPVPVFLKIKKTMKIAVIIISYNFHRWIDRCLGSLRLSTHPIDILVIDNGSQDDTVQILTQNYPEVLLIQNHENLGFGHANNIGMQWALQNGYDAVFLLNQDAWIAPDTIETLSYLITKYPQYGVISPVHLTGKGGKDLDHGFATYVGYRRKEMLPDEEIVTAAFINAAFWMIPTQVLRKIGGFSPLFYHYGEDKDFVNRLAFHNYLIGYSPLVTGCHDRENRPASTERFFRGEQVYLLSEYVNINYSFPKAFGYAVLACCKKALLCTHPDKATKAARYMQIARQLIALTPKVLKARKETRKTSPLYLQ